MFLRFRSCRAVDLRQFEIRVLTRSRRSVQVGRAVDHGDHLLRSVAEQTNSVHRITASSTSANSDAKSAFRPCDQRHRPPKFTASAKTGIPRLHDQNAICFRSAASWVLRWRGCGRARPSRSGGLLESPFAERQGAPDPSVARHPPWLTASLRGGFGNIVSSVVRPVVSFMCRTRSLMAPYWRRAPLYETGTYCLVGMLNNYRHHGAADVSAMPLLSATRRS